MIFTKEIISFRLEPLPPSVYPPPCKICGAVEPKDRQGKICGPIVHDLVKHGISKS